MFFVKQKQYPLVKNVTRVMNLNKNAIRVRNVIAVSRPKTKIKSDVRMYV